MSDQFDKDLSLELASFLLRYHVDIDYGDFTDDPFCIQKLRRYEDVKYAAEVESVTKALESLSDRFFRIEGNQGFEADMDLQNPNYKQRVRYQEPQLVMFKNPMDSGGKEALIAL